jgi:hypothetical protein
MPQQFVVPSTAYATGFDVLTQMASASGVLRGAVAFVTSSGVDLLERLRSSHASLELQIVARGAPITDPRALLRLDALGVDVAVVVGPASHLFHPKLWLARADRELHVLAGSGNLTAGGLETNHEQFEYLIIPHQETELIDLHEDRFQTFAKLAVPLASIIGSTFWAEWQSQLARRDALASQERELDERLAATVDSSVAKAQLYEDLVKLFERTRAEVRIPAPGGGDRPYVATRFKQSIDRGHRDGLIVPAVARIVREPTEGFGHLAAAGRPDLMVESLVLDETKLYHHLFSKETKAHARANLDRYIRETSQIATQRTHS